MDSATSGGASASSADRSSSPAAPPKVHALAALQSKDFKLFSLARFLFAIGTQMQSVAVGWHVYALTHRALDLGFVGLAQFLPAISLSLVTGHVADRFDRRGVVLVCYAAIAGACAALCFLSLQPHLSVLLVYAVLVFLGTARAFAAPAAQALLPHTVPLEHFPNAVTWNSTVFQIATIVGPAVGGVVYGAFKGPTPVYATAAVMLLAGSSMLAQMRVRTGRMERRAVSVERLLDGIRYVWREKVVLGSISLDLFAVLLGGAVALLPIYASDILHTGPWGLGVLRSAPAVGAATIAVLLAFRPITKRAGVTMLACVLLFGIATIVFGLSHNFWLSLVALVVVGASDMVSVVVRMTLVQIATPAEMRGRVSAVNMVFIGASNELGEFESGVTAAWLGAVPAVVLGGLGTCAVVALWSWMFPALRKVNRLDQAMGEAAH